MADEPFGAREIATRSLLGMVGLSPRTLLFVALLALLVWWYYQKQGMALTAPETAVVVLALALAVAAARAAWALLRRLSMKPDGTPK